MSLIYVEDFSILTLEEINNIEDVSLKKEMLKLYNKEIENLEKDSIGKMFIDPKLSLEEMVYNMGAYIESMSSEYLFDGDTVKFYPVIKESKAKKDILCHFSGSKIYKGSLYCNYNVFIQNVTSKKRYVLAKSINAEFYYRDMLPTDLKSFETFIYNLDNSYKNQGKTDVDYYSLACNLERWELRELGVHKNKKTTKKEK